MKKSFRILPFAALLAASLALPTAALADCMHDKQRDGQDDRKGMHHDRKGMDGKQNCKMHGGQNCGMGMHDGGIMGMHGLGLDPAIELSKEQQAAVTKLQREMRDRHHEAMGKIMPEMDRLQDLYAADTLDPKAIGEAHERIFKLRRPLFEAEAEARNRLNAILTPEQREMTGGKGRKDCPLYDPRR